MIKRTLCFSNPAYLQMKNAQLVIKRPDQENKTVPIEDIGIMILESPQITITHALIRKLQDNNVVIISCDQRHMPQSMMLPIEGNYTQSEVQRHQLDASEPLRKQLWGQTVKAKIENQAAVLERWHKPSKRLHVLARRVASGDPENIEGQAAAYYWRTLIDDFIRDRWGDYPNNLLNYGYSILRSMTARALTSSGLLLTTGIFHKNKYNAFGLADDIMEPYRPFVDHLMMIHYIEQEPTFILSQDDRRHMLQLPVLDGLFSKAKSPLMVGMSRTTASLAKCFKGEVRKIIYPKLEL